MITLSSQGNNGHLPVFVRKFLTLFVIILSLIFEFLGAIRLESEFFTKFGINYTGDLSNKFSFFSTKE